MKDTMFTKKIFSIVKTNNFNGGIELGMNHFVKCLKTREKITFIFQQVNLSSLRIIIKSYDMLAKPREKDNIGRTSNI